MANFSDSTPIAMLTVGQLKEVLQTATPIPQESKQETVVDNKNYKYGLRGIRELFDVSHATAQKYKDTFLKPAIMQNGRKLIIDADKAIELFKDAGKGGVK